MAEKATGSRVTVYYNGTVQGVGFRYSVIEIARAFNVTGYVKNLRDGRVEVCAEGDDRELVDFLQGIESSHLKRYITGQDKNWSSCENRFDDFTIQY